MRKSIEIQEFIKKTGISKSTIERLRGEKNRSGSGDKLDGYISKTKDNSDSKKKILIYEDRLKVLIYEYFYRATKKRDVDEALKNSQELIDNYNGNLKKCIEKLFKTKNRRELNKILENIEHFIEDPFKTKEKIRRKNVGGIKRIIELLLEEENSIHIESNDIQSNENNGEFVMKQKKNYRENLDMKSFKLGTLGEIFYENYERKNGFLSIQHPTGNGKTYQLEEFCAHILKSELERDRNRKIVILTNNKINRNGIAEGIRKKVTEIGELYNREVQLLFSAQDILQGKNFIRDIINSFSKNRDFFQRYERDEEKLKNLKIVFEIHENIQHPNLYDQLKESLNILRIYLEKYLKEENHRKKEVELPKFYYQLYPMIDEKNRNKKIFIMTTSKFLYGHFTGLKNEYFHEQEGNLIIIDEVDSAKEIFLEYIKKNRSKEFRDVIGEFSSRLNNLIENNNNLIPVLIKQFEKDGIYATKDVSWIENRIEKYRKEGAELKEKYQTASRYFQLLETENIDIFQRKNHFFEKNGKKLYVSEIQDHWGIGLKRSRSSFEFSTLLNELHYFSQEKLFYLIKVLVDRMDNAIFLSEEFKSLEVIANMFQNRDMSRKIHRDYLEFFSFQAKKESAGKSQDIYFQECRYVNIHRANPELNFNNRYEIDIHHMYETPESLLLNIAEKNMVFGISATAGSYSILGNFDQGWLRERLEKDFVVLNGTQRKKLREELRTINSYERDMERRLSVFDPSEYDELNYLKGFQNIVESMDEKRYGKLIHRLENILDRYHYGKNEEHNIKKSSIFAALTFLNFFLDTKTKSLLFLSNRLNRWEIIEELAGEIAKECKVTHYFEKFNSSELEKAMGDGTSNLRKNLEKGERKVIIYTAFQSAGKGVNIKFDCSKILEPENLIMIDSKINEKYNYKIDVKDIDEIALENKTHLSTINKKDPGEKLIQLYWLNILEENGVITEEIRHNIANSNYDHALTNQYKKSEDYTENALAWIIQGLGRVNRTKVKCQKRNIYLNMEAAENIAEFDINGREMVEDFIFIKDKIETEPIYLGSKRHKELAEICERKNCDIENMIMEYLEGFHSLNKEIRSSRNNEVAKEQLRERNKKYEQLRRYILEHPTIQETDLATLYLKFDEPIDSYSVERGPEREVIGIKKIEGGNISREECRVDLLFGIKELKRFLQERVGYFEKNIYIITPYLYQAIYKGKLGEIIIRELLERQGVKFLADEKKVDAGMIEIFDDIIFNGSYLDYKNFNLDNLRERENMEDELLYRVQLKSDFISQEKKLFIINLIAPHEENYSEGIFYYKLDRNKNFENSLISIDNFDQSEIVMVKGVIRYKNSEMERDIREKKLEIDYGLLKELAHFMKQRED